MIYKGTANPNATNSELDAKIIIKHKFSEKEYWEGKVPDEYFDEYLEKYGYEYTPCQK